jgi:hypothetical protein
MSQSGDDERRRGVAWAAALAACLVLALAWSLLARGPTPSSETGLAARDLMERGDTVAYAPILARFETDDPGGTRHALGFGFSGRLETALRDAAPRLQRCRQYHSPSVSPVRFQIKVRPRLGRLAVVGILEGAQGTAEHAACLRDAMEAVDMPFLGSVPVIDDARYVIHVEIRSGVVAR